MEKRRDVGTLLAFIGFARGVLVRVAFRLLYVISVPVACIILLIRPALKVTLIRLCSPRIGHYAMDTELLLCQQDLGGHKKGEINLHYISFGAPICNEQLHAMWRRTLPILPFPRLFYQVDKLLGLVLGDKYLKNPLKVIGEGYFAAL